MKVTSRKPKSPTALAPRLKIKKPKAKGLSRLVLDSQLSSESVSNLPFLNYQSNPSLPSGMVGLGNRAQRIQAVMPRIRSERGGKFGATDILVGTELLKSVSSGASNVAGDILYRQFINPVAFLTTRIRQFALLYERYRFRRLNFIYEPIASAIQSGQLISYADYDPDNLLAGDSALNLQIAASHIGQQNFQIWERASVPFGIADEYTTLYTSLRNIVDARLVYQGEYYVIAASALPVDQPLGNIYIDYEIEFSIPVLSSAAIGTDVFATLTNTNTASDFAYDAIFGTSDLTNSVTPMDNDFVISGAKQLTCSYTANGATISVLDLPAGQYIALLSTFVSGTIGESSNSGLVSPTPSQFLVNGQPPLDVVNLTPNTALPQSFFSSTLTPDAASVYESTLLSAFLIDSSNPGNLTVAYTFANPTSTMYTNVINKTSFYLLSLGLSTLGNTVSYSTLMKRLAAGTPAPHQKPVSVKKVVSEQRLSQPSPSSSLPLPPLPSPPPLPPPSSVKSLPPSSTAARVLEGDDYVIIPRNSLEGVQVLSCRH